MITQQQEIFLKEWVKSEAQKRNIEFDVLDINAEIDREITLEENKRILLEKLKALESARDGFNNDEIKSKAEAWQVMAKQQENPEELLTYDNLNKIRTIAIYGHTGSGKTALAYKILDVYKQYKKVYFIKYPKPRVIKELGYNNLHNIEELENLKDCVIYWDEPQLHIEIYDKRTNAIIAKACSLARQRNITLIISSSDTRVFTKYNEAYFDLWLVKDIDYNMVKNGSKIKHTIKEHSFIDPRGFRIKENEYLSDCRKISDFNGRHTFTLIKEWNEDLSTPYR